MDGALLVADQNVPDLFLMEQGVVDRQHRATRVAEEVFDALILQGADHHFGTGHRLAHFARSSFQFVAHVSGQ